MQLIIEKIINEKQKKEQDITTEQSKQLKSNEQKKLLESLIKTYPELKIRYNKHIIIRTN